MLANSSGCSTRLPEPTAFHFKLPAQLDKHRRITVIIDLTPPRNKTGPARLLDMVPGRSKQVFKTWLADRPETFRAGLEVVAMDGFLPRKREVPPGCRLPG